MPSPVSRRINSKKSWKGPRNSTRGLEELDSVLGEYREEQEKIYRVSRINALFQEGSRKSSTDDLARLRKFHIWEKRSAKLRADGVNER
ncbi:MAG: hypothetical protein A2Y70_06315 [Candidatus Aminicenantes bacterium RBG_13_64_14]|nr:MAG: hypothetical protein A2Y70_06315 [Candidatus Aminicenantes bacterium RBG_13_64_14]